MFDANTTLAAQFLEYTKLAQITMVYVLGLVEDKQAFPLFTYVKDKLRNRLVGDHLAFVLRIKA
jgi:hypothetical protein